MCPKSSRKLTSKDYVETRISICRSVLILLFKTDFQMPESVDYSYIYTFTGYNPKQIKTQSNHEKISDDPN